MKKPILRKIVLFSAIVAAGFGIKSLIKDEDKLPAKESAEKIEKPIIEQKTESIPTILEPTPVISASETGNQTLDKTGDKAHDNEPLIEPHAIEKSVIDNSFEQELEKLELDREAFHIQMQIAQGTNITDLDQHDVGVLKELMKNYSAYINDTTGVMLESNDDGEIAARRYILHEDGFVEVQSAGNSMNFDKENPIKSSTIDLNINARAGGNISENFHQVLKAIRDNPSEYIGKKEQAYSSRLLKMQNEIDSQPSSPENYINQSSGAERFR